MIEKLLATDPLILLLLAVFVIIALWAVKLHFDNNTNFDLLDLFMENGRISKAATVMMLSFILTSWMMVYLTLHSKITEGYMGMYAAAWIAPVVVRLITNSGHASVKSTNKLPTLPNVPTLQQGIANSKKKDEEDEDSSLKS